MGTNEARFFKEMSMKKGTILVGLVVVLGIVAYAQAQEGELHGSIGVTYQSKYIWRGFDCFDDKSAIEPVVDLDLYGTGLGMSVTGHRANSSGFEDWERWDYSLYYCGSLLEGELWQTNYRAAYVYYNYPDLSSHSDSSYDLQEIHTVLSWPNVLQVEGLVPSYVLVKLWPSNGGSFDGNAGNASGFAHILMLDYPWTVSGLLPEVAEQVLNLHAELVYNDGVHPCGGNVDHDWSNAVFGVSTDFELADNLTFTPGLYYQVTMDESVNPDDDEIWTTLGLKYAF